MFSCGVDSNLVFLITNFVTEKLLCVLQLQYGIDESYNLSIPLNGEPIYAHLEVGVINICCFFFATVKKKLHKKYIGLWF